MTKENCIQLGENIQKLTNVNNWLLEVIAGSLTDDAALCNELADISATLAQTGLKMLSILRQESNQYLIQSPDDLPEGLFTKS